MEKLQLWDRYKERLYVSRKMALSLDTSRIDFPGGFFTEMEPRLQKAYEAMALLEGGAIANPEEQRMVGHYWLRAPGLAPQRALTEEIEETVNRVKIFATSVHDGAIAAPGGKPFRNLLVVGIGGSALGPQFVADSLGTPSDPMRPYFFDNTDPDGMDKVLAEIGAGLDETLVVVISKSGGTKETRNGMLEAKAAFTARGLDFTKYAVAVTGLDSELDQTAVREGWIERFPMWDWVGGRTSVTSAVGLLPAALQGIDIGALLEGARICDEATRSTATRQNPAALLALSWYHATGGTGAKDMVILPYKDRLILFSRYLQQLIMESLGKELDLSGKTVHQGIAVYGNKGSTDQHAYVQQLREGVHNFFVTFIEVLKDRQGASPEMEPGATSGDYLSGFYQGTRAALYEKGRESLTITVDEVSAATVGSLIALYERAVGFYATLVNINAYHQPGVEAGKKAAGSVLKLQGEILALLGRRKGEDFTAEGCAAALGKPEEAETIFIILRHLAANPDHGVGVAYGDQLWDSRFRAK
ncbi:glucose-6-phosphate isomerase [Geomesophilobacter sediminis]|uniref:Glucose-6-phosphate isomerase n=1 Tax=Geomesophilobacter sediminis TaxID=2798584 RepID=A0A8J7S9T8_9BACT|nr:glucose-6-phosphate isomerase [Geomesophilobacter sediminis]MBJ6727056.1 glucose-6-phosphate isomerase [Geomesophilobacter sediminis]